MVEENVNMELNYNDILFYLKNRPPLLMIDSAVVIPGKSAVSEKYLKADEWYFECHFPGMPIMPGVLQLETIFQTAALAVKTMEGNAEKTSNISKVKNVSFRRSILPERKIIVNTSIDCYKRGIANGIGTIICEGQVVCEAEFVLAVPEDMLIMRKKAAQEWGKL